MATTAQNFNLRPVTQRLSYSKPAGSSVLSAARRPTRIFTNSMDNRRLTPMTMAVPQRIANADLWQRNASGTTPASEWMSRLVNQANRTSAAASSLNQGTPIPQYPMGGPDIPALMPYERVTGPVYNTPIGDVQRVQSDIRTGISWLDNILGRNSYRVSF